MSARPFQLSPRHRWIVYSVFAVLFLSGFAWWFADEAQEESSTPVAWAEAAKPVLIRVHGAAAFVFLVVLGTVLAVHAQRAWKAEVNHRSGLMLGGWFGVQAVTGYGLLYLAVAQVRDWTGTVHVTLGLLAPVMLTVHVVRGRILVRRRIPGVTRSGPEEKVARTSN